MSTILHLDASISAFGSQGRAVASTLEKSVREHWGALNVVMRRVDRG